MDSVYKGEVVLNSTGHLTQQVKCLEDRVEQVTKDALKYKDQCKVMTEVSKVPINQGRSFDEVHERQQKRKVASIKHGSEQALSFVKTFGVSVEKVVLRSPTKIVELTYDLPESFAGCSSVPLQLLTKKQGTWTRLCFCWNVSGSLINVITR